jgi:hypothetical protein
MIIETAIIAKIVAAKIAAAHAAHAAGAKEVHALAAKAAFAKHHPLTAGWDAAIHYGVSTVMGDPAVPIAAKLAISTAMHHGAHLTWATAAKIATPVITPMAWREFRKSELYRQLEENFRELFNGADVGEQSA